jgi:hypothetical protein
MIQPRRKLLYVLNVLVKSCKIFVYNFYSVLYDILAYNHCVCVCVCVSVFWEGVRVAVAIRTHY